MIQMPFVFAAVFALDNVLGRVLHLVGYDGLFLFQHQYAYHSARIPGINIVDFQLYEIGVVLSAAILGARLALGIVFLKEYDRFFIGVSKNNFWKLCFGLFLIPLGAYPPIDISVLLQHPTMVALLTGSPRIYFSFMSVLWLWSIWPIPSCLLFILWKLFRHHWPWATLCPENPEEKGSGMMSENNTDQDTAGTAEPTSP